MNGKLSGCRFSRPVRLAQWAPRRAPGVYALLVEDGGGYRVIYLGEAEDLAALRVDERHPAYPCWLVTAGSAQELYVAEMTWEREDERKALAKKLVAAWRPVCNYETRRALTSPDELL